MICGYNVARVSKNIMKQYLSSMILISELTFCRCPLHGLCRVYALAAGPNIYSTFVLQFLLIMMMLDPLLLIPCLEIRRFLGAIERRLRSVCAIPHPNGHCSVNWKLITNKTMWIANYEVSRQIQSISVKLYIFTAPPVSYVN